MLGKRTLKCISPIWLKYCVPFGQPLPLALACVPLPQPLVYVLGVACVRFYLERQCETFPLPCVTCLFHLAWYTHAAKVGSTLSLKVYHSVGHTHSCTLYFYCLSIYRQKYSLILVLELRHIFFWLPDFPKSSVSEFSMLNSLSQPL